MSGRSGADAPQGTSHTRGSSRCGPAPRGGRPSAPSQPGSALGVSSALVISSTGSNRWQKFCSEHTYQRPASGPVSPSTNTLTWYEGTSVTRRWALYLSPWNLVGTPFTYLYSPGTIMVSGVIVGSLVVIFRIPIVVLP